MGKIRPYLTWEEKLALKKMTTEELEASIQRDIEMMKNAKPEDIEPFPDNYIDL